MSRILCVDDDRTSLDLLVTLLISAGHDILSAADGEEALSTARSEQIDLVISDILMPKMDGYRLAMELRKDDALASIPLIFYTASYTDREDEEFAKELGAAKFVLKPTEPIALLAIIDEVLAFAPSEERPVAREDVFEHYTDRLVLKLEQKVLQLQRALDASIQAMVHIVEIRDPYTAGHQERVSRLATAIADAMGLASERVEGIRIAGMLHDIGKLSVPAEILSKPGQLTEAEFQIIQTHPKISGEILASIEFPWPVSEIVTQHHERLDGSGYPAGLLAQDIMLEARILAVADVVEAMSSHRPYRPARGLDEALAEIRTASASGLDPAAVNACCRLFESEGYQLDG